MVGKFARIYTPQATKRFEALVASCIPRTAKRPGDLVRVDVVVFLPRPKNKPRYLSKRLWSLPEPFHRAPGDVDNYAKSILDGLDSWLGNDVCVVDLRASKRISANPRTQITVYTWHES